MRKISILFTVLTISFYCSALPVFIQQSVSFFNASPSSAGSLESFQNISVIIFTFIGFSYIVRFGYKKSIILIQAIMLISGILVPIVSSYWSIKFYLITVGISLVGMKLCIYSSASIVINDSKKLPAFLSFVEAVFMFGTFVGMWIFSYTIKNYPDYWLYTLCIFSFSAAISILMLIFTNLNESTITNDKHHAPKDVLRNIIKISKNKVVIFVIVMFFISNMVETGFGAWLPGFYENTLNIDNALSIQLGSFYIAAIFIGRLIASSLLNFMSWRNMLFIYYGIGLIFLVIVLFTLKEPTHPINSISDISIQALILPLVGLFLGPNTPVLNSSILDKTALNKQVFVMTILTISYAIGSSIGARLVGELMEIVGGINGYRIITIVPMLLLFILLFFYTKCLAKNEIS